jgi:hypothetical protein
MTRAVFLGFVALLIAASPAHALLVYQRVHSGRLIAARNDGTHARVVARPRGRVVATAVSPDGRSIVYVVQDPAANADRGSGPAYIVDLRGKSRPLLRSDDVLTLSSYRSIAWSPNGRYVALGLADADRVVLIDLRAHARRSIQIADLFGGASFSPSSRKLAVAAAGRSEELSVVGVVARYSNGAAGALPAWGRRGLAHEDDKGLELITRLYDYGVSQRTLIPADAGFIYPFGWSKAGRLLAVQPSSTESGVEEDKALLVNPADGSHTVLPQAFADIEGFSRGGHDILGVVGHDVVDVHADGTGRTLARNARSPSWNR